MDGAYLKALAAAKEAVTREMDRAQRGEQPSAGLLVLVRHEFTEEWVEARSRWQAGEDEWRTSQA